MNRVTKSIAAAWLALTLVACGDSLVGGHCAPGWEPGAQGCVATNTDHDGGSPVSTDASSVTPDGAPVDTDASSVTPDGAPVDTDASSVTQDASSVTPDGAPISTDASSVIPDGAPVGDASAQDAATTMCTDPLVACNGVCVDTNTDPSNCGGCGRVCPTGVCNAGVCRDARAGHLVLIGHSFESSRRDQDRVLGNAVFLSPSPSPRVLVYQGYADLSHGGAVDNADAAITATAGARTWTRTVLTDPTHVSDRLSIDAFDAVLVYEQRNATDAQIATLATDFGGAFASFALAGGVVIVLDGPQNNSGTYPIVNATELLNVTGYTPTTHETVNLLAPADALAVGVSTIYRGETVTVSFKTADPYGVFAVMDAPVVLHRAVLR